MIPFIMHRIVGDKSFHMPIILRITVDLSLVAVMWGAVAAIAGWWGF